jgi:hypothetical protein
MKKILLSLPMRKLSILVLKSLKDVTLFKDDKEREQRVDMYLNIIITALENKTF